MKKIRQIFCTLVVAYFFIATLTPRTTDLLAENTAYLINEGYKPHAAEHIAKVELGLIPADDFYTALIED